MAKPNARELTVVRCQQLTPNMRRITLGGSELEDFPADQESGYIKLILPQENQQEPLLRTYTIRNQRAEANEMDVDFALHGDGGPASAWAKRVSPGDQISIAGPGGKKLLDFSADWFLLAGDMTALPAIGVNIERLPETARGYAVIEVNHKDDVQEFATPAGFEVYWLVSAGTQPEGSLILDKLRSLPWLGGRPSIWAACEFSTMRALRKFFKQERQVGKRDLYVSSYWKLGLSEEQHKKVKKLDAVDAQAV